MFFFQYFFTPDELKTFVRQAGFQVEVVIPASKHYALVFPEIYHRLINISPLLSRIMGLLLKPVIALHYEALNMFLTVAKKS